MDIDKAKRLACRIVKYQIQEWLDGNDEAWKSVTKDDDTIAIETQVRLIMDEMISRSKINDKDKT